MTAEGAAANEGVFRVALADVAGVENDDSLALEFSSGTRRRLDEASSSFEMIYTVAVAENAAAESVASNIDAVTIDSMDSAIAAAAESADLAAAAKTGAVAGAGADYVPIPEASSYANGGTMESVSGTNCCADPGSQSSTIAAAYPVAVAKTDAVAVAKTDAVAGAGADDVPIPEASSYANGGTMESVTGTNRCADPGSQSSTIAAAYPVAVAGAEPGSDPAADDPRSKPRSERSAVVGAVLLNPQRPANHVDAHDGRALGATGTADSSYATAEDYCDDYYSARIDEIEEAVVYGYIDEMIARSGSSANEDSLASIEAMCSPNGTNATDPGETVTALFSIRFTAYASSLFSRDDGSTLYTVKEALNAFFQSKVDSGDWASDRIAQTTDDSWTSGSQRRLEESAAAQDFISPQSVISVETTVVETRPTRAITDVDAVQRTVGAPVDRAEPEAVYVAPNDCFGVSIVEPNTEANCGTFFATDQPASDVETVREADAATDARTILSFAGAAGSTCYWIDAREINADVADAIDFIPGSNVTLVSGTIKRDCDPAAERCDCDRYANASVASAAPPDPPLIPEAFIDGPTTAASCEDLAVGSSQSTGGGGRSMVYAWNATAILREDFAASANASNATAAMRSTLASVIDAANTGTGNPSFLVSSEDLVVMADGGLHSLEVTLVLANFLGGTSAPSAPFLVQVRTDTPPNLEIVGGTLVSMTRPTALSVRANAIATSCDGRPPDERAVTIQWVLSRFLDDGSLLVTDWTSTSNDQRYFKLPAYTLEAATDYELAATAADVEAGANVTSTATISVGRAEIVAVIAGGSRVLPLAGVVELSASESYDEDIDDAFGADAGLSFAWACDDAACDAALNRAASGDAESISLRGTDIGVGSFAVLLNATAADGRSGTAHVTYELVDGDPPAVAIESSVGARVAASTKVILYGAASPSSLGNDVPSSRAFNTTWTVARGALEGAAPLAYWARTAPALSGPARDRDHDLVLASAFSLGSGEGVCQTVVAAATAASGDVALTSTMIDAVGSVVSGLGVGASLVEQTSSALLSVAANGSGLAVSAAASALDSALGLSSSSTGIGITAIAAAELGNTLSSLLDSTLFVAEDENGTNATSAGASLGAAVDGILSAQLYGAVAGEYAQSIASANLRSSAQRLSPNATSPGETRSLVLDNSASAVELPASLAGDGSYDASLAEYTSDPYAGENRGPAVTSSVTRFGLSTSSSDEASSRRRARRRALAAANATVAGGPSAIVALVIAGGIAGRPKPPGANLTCACGFTGNVSFTCPDNTTIDHACDGLPGVEAVTCPATEDACASWNSSSQAWLAQCETVQGAGGTTTCECGVDTAGDAPPSITRRRRRRRARGVRFKNLTEPPDLSRAVVMIYALLTLLLACVAAHAYGRRLDARDARRLACPDAKTLKYSSSACKLHADDDPYEAHGDYDVLMAGWKRNFFHAMDLGHPFYGWYTLYSAPVCKIFAYLAETYLVAPVPFALRWRRASEPPAGPPAAARGASSPEEEPRITTLKIDWDEAGAPEASPETFLDASSLPGSGTPVKGMPLPVVDAGDPATDEEALEILEIRERAGGGGEARARVDALLTADALQGGPLDAGESPALISERGAAGADGMPPSRLGDGMACGGFDSVHAARPAVAEEAAPVDDGDLVVPEMGEWVESLVGDLDACLAREDVEPLASGPGRGATASPRLSLASLASRGISRASFAARRATSRRTLCSDSSKTTVRDCAEMLAPTLARAVVARSRELRRAAAAATRRETARLLRKLDAHLLEAWGFHETRQIFVTNVEGAVVKRLGRAARWHAELEALDDADAKKRAAVAYLRVELLSKKERTVMTTIAERLQGELEAPEEPPGAAPLVASSVEKTRSPLDHPHYPFETPLPSSSVFYLLRWHPELNGTRIADHIAAEASGAPRSARDGLTDARVDEIHEAAIPRTSATAVAVALIALFFSLHEDIQDTIIEEVFVFLPLVSGSISERTPGLESAGEDVGAAFGIVVFGALVYVAWLAYRACGKATTRAAAALTRRKRDASGPAFRWPEDEPPRRTSPARTKSPEDAVALVLFDDGGAAIA
ncbi:hypothetical protein JL720_10521 [Aureococcus anophagefferens]|nr:hypothetical protein JL720_10521 [Aureococcus anophagefferens]